MKQLTNPTGLDALPDIRIDLPMASQSKWVDPIVSIHGNGCFQITFICKGDVGDVTPKRTKMVYDGEAYYYNDTKHDTHLGLITSLYLDTETYPKSEQQSRVVHTLSLVVMLAKAYRQFIDGLRQRVIDIKPIAYPDIQTWLSEIDPTVLKGLPQDTIDGLASRLNRVVDLFKYHSDFIRNTHFIPSSAPTQSVEGDYRMVVRKDGNTNGYTLTLYADNGKHEDYPVFTSSVHPLMTADLGECYSFDHSNRTFMNLFIYGDYLEMVSRDSYGEHQGKYDAVYQHFLKCVRQAIEIIEGYGFDKYYTFGGMLLPVLINTIVDCVAGKHD